MNIKLTIQQRVIPAYRAPFFELLANQPGIHLNIIAGDPQPAENIRIVRELENIDYDQITNIHLRSGKTYFCLQPGLLKTVQSRDPDVIIMEANPRYLNSPAAIRWMKSYNRAVIGWGLGVPERSGAFSGLLKSRRQNFLHSFDKIIAYSRKGADEYIRSGISAENVYVAANAVVSAPVSPPPEREVWREGYQPIILYVGRLQPRKKIDELINTVAELPSGIIPRLWIVGDGPIRQDLEKHARERSQEATFWGEKTGQDLNNIFRQADLFVLPGTGGLAVQQAMSHALPVIVGEGDGTQRDLVTAENGWQVDGNNPLGLRNALMDALENPAGLRQKGLNAYERVKVHVNIENMVKVFNTAIQDALEERKK